MRFRLCLLLLLLGFGAAVPAASQTAPAAEQPFSALVELWTRQLDRISFRAGQPNTDAQDVDRLRQQVADVRAAAAAAAQVARTDLADTRKLLAPLEIRSGPDQPVETEAVKAERGRLTGQAMLNESRVKQCEVIVARADQMLERMTVLRRQVVLKTLLRRDPSPLSPFVWRQIGAELAAALQGLSSGFAIWLRDGPRLLASSRQELVPLAGWAVITLGVWWIGRELRERFGRGDALDPGRRDRRLAAAVDGIGLVLAPILAVWLVAKLLAASQPPPPVDALLPELAKRLILMLLVIGMTATGLAPTRPSWRVLPFTDDAAHRLARTLRRLMIVGLGVDFVLEALTKGSDHDAIASVGALVLAAMLAVLAWPVLANDAWRARREAGDEGPPLVGGPWWTTARVALRIFLVLGVGLALVGYATLAAHLHSALAMTCLVVALALLAHRVLADLLETMVAPETPTGAGARRLFGLAPDARLHGQHIVLLLIDALLVLVVAILVPVFWNFDIEAVLRGLGQLFQGVRIGSVTISLADIGFAILTFAICMLGASLVRRVVRDRVLPTIETPLPLRQSIDAGLNYLGVAIAILVSIGALGIDFTNLAIVLGALSVGIGLGLQNIANNVISGVFLLMERPIKAGDWVSVSGHEGFVRRINIRATEIETFQRTHVIVPNSVFLQNPVINRTYSDTSSRIDIALTVPLGSSPAKMEAILRECALGHPRVLRVPAPIVRFVRVTTSGLEFELYVFVALLEDRVVVTNDLNRAILGRLIEGKIIDPTAAPEYKVRDLEKVVDRLAMALGAAPREAPGAAPATDHGPPSDGPPSDGTASPSR